MRKPSRTTNRLTAAFARQPHLERFIIHLRQRFQSKQLTMVLGAGASCEAGTPVWLDLVKRLQKRHIPLKDPSPKSTSAFGPAFSLQVLRRRFEREVGKKRSKKWPGVPNDKIAELGRFEWYNEIKRELYRDVPKRLEDMQHPYLPILGELIAECALTINFNFDDISDRAAQAYCERRKLANPHIVWKLPVAYRTKESTIFHINGYLPARAGKAASEELVLTEGAFAELLSQEMNYQSIAVLRAFAESTVLICGCSLEDTSLKAILRSSRSVNFGNYHYIIYHIAPAQKMGRQEIDDIFEANREVYNLVTIFLTSEEISELFRLLVMDDHAEFEDVLQSYSPRMITRYYFYAVGAVGAGKTTLLRNLRSFVTYEEWTGAVPEEMYKDPTLLTVADRAKVQAFLRVQLRKKNSTMKNASPGFHIMDRAYLDQIAFSESNSENRDKITMLLDHVAVDGFQDGQIVFLTAEQSTLEDRQWKRGRVPKPYGGQGYSGDTLGKQQTILDRIYSERWEYNSDIYEKDKLARKVAIDMLTSEYRPISFMQRVEYIRRGSLAKLY